MLVKNSPVRLSRLMSYTGSESWRADEEEEEEEEVVETRDIGALVSSVIRGRVLQNIIN